jgi:hypothetical protein
MRAISTFSMLTMITLALSLPACALESESEPVSATQTTALTSVDCSMFPTFQVLSFSSNTVANAICAYGFTIYSDYNFAYHIFIIAAGNQVYHTSMNNFSLEGSDWENLGGSVTSGVYASEVNGALRICAVGSDGVTGNMREFRSTTRWSDWQTIGTALCRTGASPEPY